MDPIHINHAHYLQSLPSLTRESRTFSAVSTQKITEENTEQVTLSPAAKALQIGTSGSARFQSMEAQSANKTKQVNAWLTLDELESGIRRPFSHPEEARLSTLTLSELMREIKNLPAVDEHGHLQSSFAGTEQGDRLGTAVANLKIRAQFAFEKALKGVSDSLADFEEYVESHLGISPETYSVKHINGEITVVVSDNGTLNNPNIKKIQNLIDAPKHGSKAEEFVSRIEEFNRAASELINNRLTLHTEGQNQNPYLPKRLSVEEIMDGVNYSGSAASHLSNKWLNLVESANAAYREAITNGSHLENTVNPGIRALTKKRENS